MGEEENLYFSFSRSPIFEKKNKATSVYRLVIVRPSDGAMICKNGPKINAAPSNMLPCFDGLISRSNAQTSQEKDVPCVYLPMNKLSIWGSREESRVSGTRKETQEREAESPLARALSRRLCAYLFA